MFSELFHVLKSATQASETAAQGIELTYFVDLEFDRAGWYALGHHDPDDFLAMVRLHDADSIFVNEPVQLAWASIAEENLQLSHLPYPGFQPITYVEGWD